MAVENSTAVENRLNSWDWANQHVQPRDSVSESRFINGATVLIAAGPPRLAGPSTDKASYTSGLDAGSNLVYPIGVCMDASIQQSRQLQRIYEIGSERSFFVQGRHAGGVQLNRVLFNGANLLRVLYAYYPRAKVKAIATDATVAPGYEYDTTGTPTKQDEAYLDSVANTASGSEDARMRYVGEQTLPDIEMNPGYNNNYINLASDLFQQPMGLMFLFQDVHKHTVSSFYLEMCFVQAHSMGIQGQTGTLIAESVQMQFDRIAPIKIT